MIPGPVVFFFVFVFGRSSQSTVDFFFDFLSLYIIHTLVSHAQIKQACTCTPTLFLLFQCSPFSKMDVSSTTVFSVLFG